MKVPFSDHPFLILEHRLHQHSSPAENYPISQIVSSHGNRSSTAVIGWILRIGAIASAAIILFGMVLFLFHGGTLQQSIPAFPHTLGTVFAGLLLLQPQAIIALGIMLLIATPVITVTASVIAFAIEHDRHFVIIALVVLFMLIASLLVGKGV